MDGEPVLVVNQSNRRPKAPIAIGIAVLVILLLGAGSWALFGRRKSDSLQQGIDAYRGGQREVAVSAFNKAARDDPSDPLPHIYLARMDREVGNFTAATDELKTAITLDPSNALALREMGANMLAKGDNELARTFYVRAVLANPKDSTAMGYLGCSLMRLNRVSEATTFLNRAGPGPWSNCTPPTAQAAPARAPTSIPR
jgi:Flp pilus assembly protein TadD